MKMDAKLVERYIELFENNGVELENRKKYKDYMLISQFNDLDPSLKLVNKKKKKSRFLSKF